MAHVTSPDTDESSASRRSWLAGLTMGSGLLSGYGFFAAIAARFLYPAHPEPEGWLFVARVADFKRGDSFNTQTPAGQPVVITRRTDDGTADDFIALSRICPHLGCMVHWEANHNRFFCPCHNGAFNPEGTATQGPPYLAHQSLSRFPLQIENGLLFVRVRLNGSLG